MDFRNVIRNPNLVPCTYKNLTIFHYRRGHLKDIHSVVLGSVITAKGIRQEKAFIHTLYNQRDFFFLSSMGNAFTSHIWSIGRTHQGKVYPWILKMFGRLKYYN